MPFWHRLFGFKISDTSCSNMTNNGDIFEAAKSGNVTMMYFFMECNVTDLNSINIDGKTPLYLAAQEGHEESVKLLLAHAEIDVNKGIETGTIAGAPPIWIASRYGHEEVVKLLLAHQGTDVNLGIRIGFWAGITSLYMACGYGHAEVVKLLLAHHEVDVNKGRTSDGSTPLMVAVAYHPELLQILLQHHLLNVNQARHSDGKTPLFLAAFLGHDSGNKY